MDLTNKFLNKNRAQLASTPVRIPMKKDLKKFDGKFEKFSSLPRKKTKIFQIRRVTTESKLLDAERLKIDLNVTSPNGLTENSIRRLKSMRDSQMDTSKLILMRKNMMLDLDSEFEDKIEKIEKSKKYASLRRSGRLVGSPLRHPQNYRNTFDSKSLPRRPKIFKPQIKPQTSVLPRKAMSESGRMKNRLNSSMPLMSSNGLTDHSIRRLAEMKNSKFDITKILDDRKAQMLDLDSDFDNSIGRISLKRHERVKNLIAKDESSVYPCGICKRVFYHHEALEVHTLMHSGRSKSRRSVAKVSKEFECNNCHKNFSSKWKLRFHQAIHFNEKSAKVLIVL
jgi:hypothetical protein